MRRRARRAAFVVAGLVGVAAVAGGAYAYWGTGGAGTASLAVATTTSVTLSPATPTAGLYPGSSAGVTLTVTNPNAAQVHVSALALDPSQGTGGFGVDGSHPSCNVGSMSFSTQTNGGSGWTVPGKVGGTNGSLPITLANSVSMSASASDACQGASFTVYLKAS
jgi:hypothetical protein